MVIKTHRWHEHILTLSTVCIESIKESIIVDGIASTTIVRHALGGQWTLGVLVHAGVHETGRNCCNYYKPMDAGHIAQHTFIATLNRTIFNALRHAGRIHSTRVTCGAAHVGTRVQIV